MSRAHCSLPKLYLLYPILFITAISGFSKLLQLSRTIESTAIFSRIIKDFNSDLNTKRLGCLEHPKGGQTCIFGGISCIDLNSSNHVHNFVDNEVPVVYFVSEEHWDFENATHDHWCNQRYRSADINYWGPRVWPPPNTFVPRQSCLTAKWRKYSSIFKAGKNQDRIRWVSDLAMFNLDFREFDHNNHYLMDLIWFLDFRLWNDRQRKSFDYFPNYFSPPETVFFPQSRSEFDLQTRKDINRLLFALIFGKNLSSLYRHQRRKAQNRLETKSLFDAYNSLNYELIFSREGEKSKGYNSSHDLLCTERLLVGHKTGNLADERVCTYIREKSWEFYNATPELSFGASGYLWIDRPPKRVVILDRHLNRKFHNLNAISKRLSHLAKVYSFDFQVYNTSEIVTAEEHVKFFSRVGVLLTPHGSHSMGLIWMPRYSALIESFPPIYYDYSFRSLSEKCNVQFFELHGKIIKEKLETYKTECGPMFDSHYDQCAAMKNEDIFLDVEETTDTVLMALRKIGYKIDPSRFVSVNSMERRGIHKFVFSEEQQNKIDRRNAAWKLHLSKLVP